MIWSTALSDIGSVSSVVVLCGSDASVVEGMNRAVRGSLGWEVLPVVGGDAAALERARTSAVRCVVLVGEADTAVERMVAEREASVPLLVVGGALRAGLVAGLLAAGDGDAGA